MKKILYFACLCCMLFSWASCEKKNKEKEPQLGSLYGVVTDKTTGEPVRNAGVELLPLGRKSVTGNDGNFEFINIEEGTYKLFVTKAGYKDTISNDIIVKSGLDYQQHSIQIEKLPPTLSVLDEEGHELTNIDFGSNQEVVMRSFIIFNNGEETMDWSIVYAYNWISFVSEMSGKLKPNATQSIVIKIDRNKLNEGDNSTTVHVISNNGTKEIIVSASLNDVVETLAATDILAGSAVLNGKISRNMEPAITEYGFVYGKKAAPTIFNGADKASLSGTPPIATYNTRVSNLEKNTQYYARAYVTNGVDTVYGDQISFLTVEGLPSVKTLGYSNLTSISAVIQCSVTDDAGEAITESGVCYSMSPLPTFDGQHTSDGKGLGTWESELTGLLPNATYYIRAYAKNINGPGYGDQITITTREGYAKVKTGGISAVTSNSAVCGGEVISDGDREVTERGVCWSTKEYPTINDNHSSAGSGIGSFTCTLNNLEQGVTYNVRAYAKNSAGVAYGENVSFKTLSGPPVVTTLAAKSVTGNSAIVSGTIVSNGGEPIDKVGFYYQAENEYYKKDVQTQLSDGSFSCQLENLDPDTKYYVSAYATNSRGTGEGKIVDFTTKSGLPIVSTGSYSDVRSTTAVVTGKILSDGEFAITECGICYSSTNKRPTKSDNVIKSTLREPGQYSCNLTNLEPSTTYYACAYAENTNGITYGTYISFKTSNGMPKVSILQQPTYSGKNATVYGEITSDGGADIVYYGVVISRTNTMPSIENKESILNNEGAPITNNITFTFTNVPSMTMIYYRFYVVNSLAKVAYSDSGYLLTTY